MKVRVHPSFFLYLLLVGMLASWTTCFSSLFALLVHELGHCLVGKVMGEEIALIELTPFGGVIHRRHHKASLKGLRGIAIALAGPLSNYVWLGALTALPLSRLLCADLQKKLIMSNLVMMSLNLLPVLPLDGGQVAFCLGYYFFRLESLITFLTSMGQLLGGMLIAIDLYAFYKTGIFNCSVFIIGAYLIKHACSQKRILRSENLYLLVRERLDQQSDGVRKVSFYSAPPDMPLYAALAAIDSHTESVFIIQDAHGVRLVGEKKLCYEMMNNPGLLFEQIAVPIT